MLFKSSNLWVVGLVAVVALCGSVTMAQQQWQVAARTAFNISGSPSGLGLDGAGQLLVTGKDSLTTVNVTWNAAHTAFTVDVLSTATALLSSSAKKAGFDHVGGGSWSASNAKLFAAASGAQAGTSCGLATFERSASAGWKQAGFVQATGQVDTCECLAFVNGPLIGLPNEFVAATQVNNVTKLYQYIYPFDASGFNSSNTLLLPLHLVGATGVMGVRGLALSNGVAYLVTDDGVNPGGANFFVFDMIAVFHAEQPWAPLLFSARLPYGGGARGVAVSPDGSTLWVVAVSEGKEDGETTAATILVALNQL